MLQNSTPHKVDASPLKCPYSNVKVKVFAMWKLAIVDSISRAAANRQQRRSTTAVAIDIRINISVSTHMDTYVLHTHEACRRTCNALMLSSSYALTSL